MIDAHHHFWDPARGDYGWMPEGHPVLSRVYRPGDLRGALAASGVEQTVLVQAAPSVAETEYLLGIAEATPFVAKVVGWIDFERPSDLGVLKRLAEHPKFAGVRPMIQDLPDVDWMLRPDVQWAYEALVALDLSFDCLGFPQHLANFHTLLVRYPEMRAVIDHCMKPQLRAHSAANFANWADGMSRLAEDTGAYCKLSGLVTEADEACTPQMLQPYVDHVIGAFGAERVMWGSDWPVARLACEYGDWVEMARGVTAGLSAGDQAAVFGETAARFYRI